MTPRAMLILYVMMLYTRVIPEISGLDILDNNIFYNLYISETYIFYEL